MQVDFIVASIGSEYPLSRLPQVLAGGLFVVLRRPGQGAKLPPGSVQATAA